LGRCWDELDSPAFAGLFDNLFGGGNADHEGEGDHGAAELVKLEYHSVGSGGAGDFASDSHVKRLREGCCEVSVVGTIMDTSGT
jgi:hypothetical protein